MKEQVRESDTPRRIKSIKFGVLAPQEIHQLSEFEVVNRELYQGTSNKAASCDTCHLKMADCPGHYAHIQLELPVFHIGYFKAIIQILQNICKTCSRPLLEESERLAFLAKMRNPRLDGLQKKALVKKINERCRKTLRCPHCDAINGMVRKAGALKLIHEKQKPPKKNGQSDSTDAAADEFRNTFADAIQFNPDIRAHLSKAQEDLNPLRVLRLFEAMLPEDAELFGLDPVQGPPTHFIWTYLPVPPVAIRPSVAMETAVGSNEDDLTIKLMEIVHINNIIKTAMERGAQIQAIMEDWDFLQLQCAMYINSELPGVPLAMQTQGKPIRGLCQRLKGKTGRFRGNLSGKRVDFSSRTVISPDPNLRVNEVAVPELVAKTLTYPERVFEHNIERLRQAILNGPYVHPGANFLQTPDGRKMFLKYVPDRQALADKLRPGYIVERHLIDGDIVLFNRQPSLHKLSIMAHFVKVRPYRTFRLNECVCTPYNADFDGDEMNLHVPQTEEARAEALLLMGVQENLVTPRNGEPVIAATQDFITACFLLSRRDQFFTLEQFCRIVSYLGDSLGHIDIPPPTIWKPKRLWTGKQIFNVLLRPNKASNVLVNLVAKCRTYSGNKDMCPYDGYLVIRNSEIMCGQLDKSNVGSGSKSTIFYVLMRDFGPAVAVDRMSQLAKLCARWLGNHGFSIGIDDVRPGVALSQKKESLVEKGYSNCLAFIEEFNRGELQLAPGCTAEETLEPLAISGSVHPQAKLTGELSRIRDDAGQICFGELNKYNSPLIMAKCGSKGSKINISQMIACVGQQVVSGSRIPEGFVNRTLPHFAVGAKTPAAKGFVRNSFYTGMTPTEFFFHTMGGREGLVDTAVKTAETGYMQRRLMKALEDLSTQYDISVRNSSGMIVQFRYGDDGLDPANMEDENRPVDFARVLTHCQWVAMDLTERSLNPAEIKRLTDEEIGRLKQQPQFTSLFLDDLDNFLTTYCTNLAALRKRHGLAPMDTADAMESDDIASATSSQAVAAAQHVVDSLMRLTASQLDLFFKTVERRYIKSVIEPGTAVGAIGAQSIGEPGTQMTLKTFHFAGVASMNVTLGVPRIKEIINASKQISTPIITAKLVNETSVPSARIVKGRIEKTVLGEITAYIREVHRRDESYLLVRLDLETIRMLQLEVTAEDVAEAIQMAPKVKLKVKVYAHSTPTVTTFVQIQQLKQLLPKVIVKGIPTVNRAVVNTVDVSAGKYNLLVEGYGLRSVMATEGVDGRFTTSNHVMEVEKVLGIEAARTTIMHEIQYTMSNHGMSIDTRHVMLLADLMSCKGEILGITRFGIAKMKDSVLMLASFEKTTDHLFDAAIFGKSDSIEGVSECIIMGVPMPIGTGLFKVLQHMGDEKPPTQRALIFDNPVYHESAVKAF